MNNPLIGAIRARLHRLHQNFIMAMIGGVGTGKSYTALAIAETIDPSFNVDRVFFKIKDFVNAIDNKQIKKGQMCVVDEAGVGWASRSAMHQANRDMSACFQLLRYLSFGTIFTSPTLSMIDLHGRQLLHATGQTITINRTEKYCRIKYKMREINPLSGRFFDVFPRVRGKQEDKRKIKVKYLEVYKPSSKLITSYEKKKRAYAERLFTEINDRLHRSKDSRKEGQPTHGCESCGYTWTYTGKRARPNCPSCGTVKVGVITSPPKGVIRNRKKRGD